MPPGEDLTRKKFLICQNTLPNEDAGQKESFGLSTKYQSTRSEEWPSTRISKSVFVAIPNKKKTKKQHSAYQWCIVLDMSLPALPQPCSVHYLIQNYLDINCVPRRSFFEFLLYFAEDEMEKEKLQEFCSSEGQVLVLQLWHVYSS